MRLTLKLHGNYSQIDAAKVNEYASLILQQLASAITVIAVHNNSNGNYSLLSYLKGGKLFKSAMRVNKVPESDPDDFFLTNSPRP